jgi:hypothetical protein
MLGAVAPKCATHFNSAERLKDENLAAMSIISDDEPLHAWSLQ